MATSSRNRPPRPSVAIVPTPRPSPRRVVVHGEIVTPRQNVPAVVRLTTSILRTHRAVSTSTAKAAIDIGRQLAHVHARLERGQWLQWIREAVPFTPRTVQNYLALAEWADREPDHLARFGHLGPSKLYRIASLSTAARNKLKVDTPIPIAGGGRKLLDVMTVAELDRAIGDVATPPVVRAPVEKIVQGYRTRLAGLGALHDQLVKHKRDVDRGLAKELIAERHGLAQTLEAAFGR